MTKQQRSTDLYPTVHHLQLHLAGQDVVTAGAGVARWCALTPTGGLWDVYRFQVVRATALGVIDKPAGSTVHGCPTLFDPETGAQLHLWVFGMPAQAFGVNIVPASGERFTERYWLTPDHRGVVDAALLPGVVPEHVEGMLRRALPMPRPDRLYGRCVSGVVDALYDVCDDETGERDDRMVSGMWVEGTTRSYPGGRGFGVAAWWADIAAGRIIDLTRTIARSRSRVEIGPDHNGEWTYVLVRPGAHWTGWEGPVLYRHDLAVSLDHVLHNRAAVDLRPALAGASPWRRTVGAVTGLRRGRR
jgi:hypothetical protein